jgi:hypothetical protein
VTAITLRASAQQVAVAWLSGIAELAGVPVAATLPPPAQWGGQDFVTVGPSMGGIPSAYLLTRVPVLQVDAWAVAPNSTRPAWNRASATAEAIRDACYGSSQSGAIAVKGFETVWLNGARAVSEPRRMLSDVAAIARYMITIQLMYSPAVST